MQVSAATTRLVGKDLELNLPNAMREAGYRTGASGKWHLKNFDPDIQPVPEIDAETGLTPVLEIWPEYSVMQQLVQDAGFDWADGIYDHSIIEPSYLQFSHNMEWVTASAKVRNYPSFCIVGPTSFPCSIPIDIPFQSSFHGDSTCIAEDGTTNGCIQSCAGVHF